MFIFQDGLKTELNNITIWTLVNVDVNNSNIIVEVVPYGMDVMELELKEDLLNQDQTKFLGCTNTVGVLKILGMIDVSRKLDNIIFLVGHKAEHNNILLLIKLKIDVDN